jgi:23S rRNA pseudouridine955/2504/2580 synthase
VINKPAGLAVQGGKGIGVSLDSILAARAAAAKAAASGTQRPLLVHRLDRDTSGLILAAKTKEAAAGFSRLFGNGAGKKSVVKQYIAICKGVPKQPQGVIMLDIAVNGKAKESETRYRQLSVLAGGAFSMLELELGTGRMHQIRRHLAMTGNPVLGDDKYGDFSLNKMLRKTIKLRHLLLHASRLIIPQTPLTGANLDLTAPLPDYFYLDIPAVFFP